MAERERLHYEQDQQQIKENITKSEEELQILVHKLKEAKQERSNKIEYDELAVEVTKFPSRELSQDNIASLKAEILELEQEAYQQSQVMELRKKQFFTALLCLQSIQESIEEDQREEAKRLFHKRTHHDDDEEEEEEGGFDETVDNIAPTTSTPAIAVTNGLDRYIVASATHQSSLSFGMISWSGRMVMEEFVGQPFIGYAQCSRSESGQ
ncbi:THO complex subunit 7 [Mortierella sp. NVP85]|nr:THO complex subunit 7 [Mortierella sp. NVP85]